MTRPAAPPWLCPVRRRAAGGQWSAWTAWLVGLALLLAAPASARRAATISGGERVALLQKAQPLITQASAAIAAGDLLTAAKSLSSAYRIAPLPEVLLHLARLAQAEKRAVDAYDLYRRYLADPTRIPEENAQREAEAVLATPAPPSGSVSINGPPSALVLVDGRVVGVLPLPQPLLLEPADHTLVLDLGNKRLDTPLPIAEGRLCDVRTSRGAGALLISVLPALLVLDDWPGVPAELVRPFSDAIERAAIVQQLGVMPKSVAAQKGRELLPCLSTLPCQQQLAKRSGLDYVLRTRTTRLAPPVQSATASWSFELALLHVEVGAPASSVSVSCEACTVDQAVARYRDALTELLAGGLPRQYGTADLTSEPPGAQVFLGAQELGKTPLKLPLWEGKYELALRLPGYGPASTEVPISAGQQLPVTVTLEPDAGVVVQNTPVLGQRLRRPRWRLAVGGTLIGTAAVLLNVGSPLVAIQGSCAVMDPGAVCKYFYDTAASGGAVVGLGITAGIAGGILLIIPGPRRK